MGWLVALVLAVVIVAQNFSTFVGLFKKAKDDIDAAKK